MQYYLKIKSESDNLILIEGFVNKILKKNSFISLKLDLNENENFIINVEPLEKNDNLCLPYKIFVQNANNTLNILSNNVEVLSFENKFILNLKNLEIVKNMNVLESTNSYSIFNTIVTNITTKDGTINLPKLFPLIETKKVGQNTIICLENESEKYVVVIHGSEVIFKDYYSEINLENKIEILSCLYDIAKHALLTIIENKTVTQKTVYTKNEPIFTSSPNIIPLAFLQALKVNNINLCKHYLSENLKEIANIELLKSYFGDYKKIEFDYNRYILFYENTQYKIFEFEIENNKISKLILIN